MERRINAQAFEKPVDMPLQSISTPRLPASSHHISAWQIGHDLIQEHWRQPCKTLFSSLTSHVHHPGIQIYVSPVNARSLGNPQTAIGTQRYCSTNLRLTSLITSFQRSHKVTAAYW